MPKQLTSKPQGTNGWSGSIHDRKLKELICEIGRRVYNKGFAAANDGNISIRVGENEVICSPTMICKGFMTPEDICAVDSDGNQIAGQAQADQRDPPAPGDHEGTAGRQGGRPLPSAACHGIRRRGRADSAVRAARGRSLHGRNPDRSLRDAGRAEIRRHRACRSSRERAASSSKITAR